MIILRLYLKDQIKLVYLSVIFSFVILCNAAAFADVIYISDDGCSVHYLKQDSSGKFQEIQNVLPKITNQTETEDGYKTPYYDRIAAFKHNNKERVFVIRRNSDSYDSTTVMIYAAENFSKPLASKNYDIADGHWSGVVEFGNNILVGQGHALYEMNPETCAIVGEPYFTSDFVGDEFDLAVHDGLIYLNEAILSGSRYFKLEIMDKVGHVIGVINNADFADIFSSGENLYCKIYRKTNGKVDGGVYLLYPDKFKNQNMTFDKFFSNKEYYKQVVSFEVAHVCSDGKGGFFYTPDEHNIHHYDGTTDTTVYYSSTQCDVAYDPASETLLCVSYSSNEIGVLKKNSSGKFTLVQTYPGLFEEAAFISKISFDEEPEPDPLKISGTFKGATVSKDYSGTATVTGGKATYKWTKSGTASEWLSFNKTTGAKVTLKGTPPKTGTFKLKLKVTDANKTALTKTFTIKVAAKPKITGTFNGATLETKYSGSATVSGGTAPYTWSKSGVPTGMTYKASGAKVTLSGKPTKTGSYKFKVTAKDANGASVSKTFTIKVAAKPKITGTFNAGAIGKYYSGTATVTGGTAPYTWTQSGKPAGLTFKGSETSATLSGKPTTAKTYTCKITVTDANGAAVTKSFKIKISAASTSSLKDTEAFDEDEVIDVIDINYDYNIGIDTSNAENSTISQTQNYEPAVTELKILSEDILWQGEGRNEDLFEVKANSPVRFIIGEWKHANGAKEEIFAEDVEIFIDDKLVEGITVSDEGEFTVPAEFVHDDFKVCAKAKELETIELFIGAIE